MTRLYSYWDWWMCQDLTTGKLSWSSTLFDSGANFCQLQLNLDICICMYVFVHVFVFVCFYVHLYEFLWICTCIMFQMYIQNSFPIIKIYTSMYSRPLSVLFSILCIWWVLKATPASSLSRSFIEQAQAGKLLNGVVFVISICSQVRTYNAEHALARTKNDNNVCNHHHLHHDVTVKMAFAIMVTTVMCVLCKVLFAHN